MLSLQEHIAAESARWAASRREVCYDDEKSVASSTTTTSTADSLFSSRLHCKYNTHRLSRRSSTSSFATEFEPEPAQQPFVVPRDFNGAPITVYASLEAAVAQRLLESQGQGQGQVQGEGGGGELVGEGGGEQPRRLVTAGKLYENEEDDDEIIYE
ncbi:hypothetical protein ONZ43_g2501 [Nemania bipapillata]|uniref:Uncharacterized protein n=1 Tax=Nemania bipapillata TaxID=110536 RepID=A0ACC2J0F9_9PEZI|nr:hypothetical protein ONZ43_g2501 [Nemania bipapillata]